MVAQWTLQDAKNRFSAVVKAALAGEPQRVTRRGRRLDQASAPSLPDLLMALPQDDEDFERLGLTPRDVSCS